MLSCVGLVEFTQPTRIRLVAHGYTNPTQLHAQHRPHKKIGKKQGGWVLNKKADRDRQVNRQKADNRLRWKCRRGMLELDIMLQSFLHKDFENLSSEDARYFEQLLDYEDNPLFELLMGHMQPADPAMKNVIKSIQRATCAEN